MKGQNRPIISNNDSEYGIIKEEFLFDDALPNEFIELLNYLPNSFESISEGNYITNLKNSFSINYINKKHQFSLLACHMLYMSSVYFSIWQIKENLEKDFFNSLSGFTIDAEKKLLEGENPFSFSNVSEKKALRFFRLVQCGGEHIGEFTKLVKDRDKIAHPNGILIYNSDKSANNQVKEILKQLESIQKFMNPLIEKCFKRFLFRNCNEDKWQYIYAVDVVREILVHGNYLSQKDIEVCLNYDIKKHKSHKKYKVMSKLYKCLKEEYANF